MARSSVRTRVTRAVALLAVAVLPAACGAIPADEPAAGAREEVARNVIFVLGDGLGQPQRDFLRLASAGPSGQLAMDRLDVAGTVDTKPAYDDQTTDAAAAATAFATGVRTTRGAIGIDVDGQPVETALEAARDAGKATGLVTTGRVTDPGTAAFAAHADETAADAEIAEQYLDAHVDVILGGGASDWRPAGGRTAASGMSHAGGRSNDEGTPEPGTVEPAPTQPDTAEADTTEPGTTEPGTTEPGTTEPGTTEPGTTEPGTTEPGTTEPGTTEPGPVEPTQTDQGGADPEGINPGLSDPDDDPQIDPGTDDRSARGPHDDLAGRATAAGYTRVSDAAELAVASSDRLLGLFADQEMFRPGGPGEGEYQPEVPLATMTDAALDTLDRRPAGFFLVVEEAGIGAMAREHNAGSMLDAGRALDGAVESALRYQATHPDTLIVVAGDAEAGGMRLTRADPGAPPAGTDGPFSATDSDQQLWVDWSSPDYTDALTPITAGGPGAEGLDGQLLNTQVFTGVMEAMSLAG